jgi:hypothetical protein
MGAKRTSGAFRRDFDGSSKDSGEPVFTPTLLAHQHPSLASLRMKSIIVKAEIPVWAEDLDVNLAGDVLMREKKAEHENDIS